GYADFRVTSAVAELTPDRKDFFITFTVEEGEEYNFGEISVETSLEKLDAERLENFVGIQEGALFNAEQIENAEDSLTFAAGVAGYAFVDIRPRISRNRVDRTVDITFQVNEGPRVYIERINIGGNTRTLDQIIRREMRIAEGDAFNRILLDRSEQRVRSLGFFGQVEVTEEPGTTPDRSIVNLSVEERSTGTFSVGVGFSSIDNFIADVSIQERNLLGRGQFLRFRVSASSRRQQIDLRFTEPYFLDRNLAAGFELFSIRTNFRESSFDNFTNGVGINAGFPISEYGRMGLRYTFRLDDIDIDNDILCENELNARTSLCRSAGQRTTSSIGYSVSYDFRNDPIRPSRGWRWVWSQDLAGVGGDVNYVRTETSISYFKPIWKGLIANVRGNAGYIEGWAGRDVRLNDRFFRGATSFRGFRVAGVGPRDLDLDDPIGGKLYAIGTAEVFFPLGLPEEFGVRAGLFSDFGTVGLLDPRDRLDPFTSQDGIEFEGTRDDLSLRVTAGVSVSWDSPFGPIRLDFAEVFAREDYDRTEGFRFSAGTSF
ncbi:MAG: outer membrane protein assembly factor BamA, partial [Pseudomonadota bacterium]